MKKDIVLNPSNPFAWVITGLIQSDGNFRIKIVKVNYGLGYSVGLLLSIELRIESLPLFKSVHSYFGCGRLSIREDRNMCIFEITDIHSLWHVVIPHFLKYPLFGLK